MQQRRKRSRKKGVKKGAVTHADHISIPDLPFFTSHIRVACFTDCSSIIDYTVASFDVCILHADEWDFFNSKNFLIYLLEVSQLGDQGVGQVDEPRVLAVARAQAHEGPAAGQTTTPWHGPGAARVLAQRGRYQAADNHLHFCFAYSHRFRLSRDF